MKIEVLIFAVGSLVFLSGAVVFAAGPLWVAGWRRLSRTRDRPLLSALAISVAAIAFMRPHEDTLFGLDVSGYRHMAAAFADGRGFHDPDYALLEAPLEIRSAFLLLPTMDWRNTRDRSFQITSLEQCDTEPFFYPLVPATAAVFGKLIPGTRDYLLPLLNTVLWSAVFFFALSSFGWTGAALSCAMLLATPLPVWFLRGYVPEGTGALLCACAILQESKDIRTRAGQAFILGMAISLHPMLAILAVPVFAVRLLATGRWVPLLFAFGFGLVPFVVMNGWICHPYGDIFDLSTWLRNIDRVREHRVLVGFLAVAAGLFASLAIYRIVRSRKLRMNHGYVSAHVLDSRLDSALAKWVLACLAVVPSLFLMMFADTRDAYLRGASEAWSAFRVPGAVLFAASSIVALACLPHGNRWPVVLGLAALQICFVLKGLEVPGLWHQRRLLPGVLFLAIALVPVAGVISDAFSKVKRYRFGMTLFATLVLIAIGSANAIRWPALYTVRNEAGAQDWMDRLSQALGGKTAFFDYHTYSFPLAVDVRRSIYGLGRQSRDRLTDVVGWLTQEAQNTGIVFVTAFENPGLEQGVVLSSAGMLTGTMQRVRSKTALPAESYHRELQVELLNVIPIETSSSLPTLSKVFDGGPLALRGEWLPRVHTLRTPDGRSVPAQWFRNGAGVIGPVAHEGELLVVKVQGTAGRRDQTAVQTIKLFREDGSVLGEIALSNRWTTAEIKIVGKGSGSLTTATYRFHVDAPYNPATEKIRGYPADLGALIHRIDMWIEPADNRADE